MYTYTSYNIWMLNFQLCIHLAEEARLESKSEKQKCFIPRQHVMYIYMYVYLWGYHDHPSCKPPTPFCLHSPSSLLLLLPTPSHHIQRTASENEQATGKQERETRGIANYRSLSIINKQYVFRILLTVLIVASTTENLRVPCSFCVGIVLPQKQAEQVPLGTR